MISILSIAFAATVCTVGGESSPAGPPASITRADTAYRSLYEAGQTFADFVAKADRRKEQWESNFAKHAAPDALVTRARAAGSGWRILVVTVPGCSDSVNSVPYLASFVEQLPGVEMRLVNSTVGRAVMESHRTSDGRPATPTVILLDQDYNERGCWIERPAPLRAWLDEHEATMSASELFDGKMKWYDEDAGASSLEDIVQVLEAAARGEKKCA